MKDGRRRWPEALIAHLTLGTAPVDGGYVTGSSWLARRTAPAAAPTTTPRLERTARIDSPCMPATSGLRAGLVRGLC